YHGRGANVVESRGRPGYVGRWMERQGKRLRLIDGLRGVAAALVLILHMYLATFNRAHHPRVVPVLNAVVCGFQFAVILFFVISGFVIAYSVRDATVTGRYFFGFAV